MVRIPLSADLVALIDDADEQLVAGFAWHPFRHPHGMIYAHAWNGHQHFYMHRLISGAAPKERVDHENRDGLDNQRRNLRISSPSQNGANRLGDRRKLGSSSQYKGVCWDKNRSTWNAYIHVDGKTRALGRFPTEIEAAQAYDHAATGAWGRFARLNLS